jgi:hypothetical protein
VLPIGGSAPRARAAKPALIQGNMTAKKENRQSYRILLLAGST